MRLDKYLAHAGIGTRKEVKLMIRKKHVTINGELCIKDDVHICEDDIICVDNKQITYQSIVYIMLHKPQGVISATSDSEHTTVMECIDAQLPNDCFPVGRLDIDTEGLLLISNDGKLAHALLSPKRHIDKTYYAEIDHALSNEDIETLENGSITLDDEQIQQANVEVINQTSIYLTIREGRYHQVKRMLSYVHNEVVYLKRIRMGTLELDATLNVGEWRYLTQQELDELLLYK